MRLLPTHPFRETDNILYVPNIVSFNRLRFPAFSFLRVWMDHWGGQRNYFTSSSKSLTILKKNDAVLVASYVSRIGSITQKILGLFDRIMPYD